MSPGVIVVTGASRGIGAAIATELARRGHRVAGLSRSGTVPAVAGELVPIACDITDEAALARALEQAAGLGGGIAGLVNNAGVQREDASRALAKADFAAVLDTNVLGTFGACRAAYPHLVAAGGGLIVNIGSIWQKLGARRYLAYCASKAAVDAITRCLAAEWAGKNIRVLTVAPGYIETEMTRQALADEAVRSFLAARVPVRRTGQPAEVARLIAALFGEDIGFLTGETIYLDGGHGIGQ